MNGPGKKGYGDFERRKYFRHKLIYSPKQAKLNIGDHDYKVLDFSSEGLRFQIDKDSPFEKEIYAALTFSDGESRVIEGTVVWIHGDEIGVKFKTLDPDI